MKKIIALIMATAMIAAMSVASASAIFAEKTAGGGWVWTYEDSELEYPVTKYATDYEGKTGLLHFTNYEYVLQRIDLVNPADGISFGTATDANNQCAYNLDIKIYKYDTNLDNSLNGEVLYQGTSPIAYSSWRTSYKFDETLQPGSYVVELSSSAEFVNYACVAVSQPVEGHSSEVYLSEGIQGDVANVKNSGYILSYRTFLNKDYVPAEETEAPAEETEAPAEETEAPAEETEAPAEETEAPAEETEAPAEKPEAPAEKTEAPAEETQAPADDEEKGGCGSVIAGSGAMLMVMAAAVLLKKRS